MRQVRNKFLAAADAGSARLAQVFPQGKVSAAQYNYKQERRAIPLQPPSPEGNEPLFRSNKNQALRASQAQLLAGSGIYSNKVVIKF